MKNCKIFLNTMFGKKLVHGYVVSDLILFKVVRFETYWTDTDEYTWRTRVKFFWNVLDK